MQRGDLEEYLRLAGPQRRSLRHDKQQWAEQIASSKEARLLRGEIQDVFGKFHLHPTHLFLYGSECWAVTKRDAYKMMLSVNGVCESC